MGQLLPSTNHRILVIDDNRAIHGDFQKILGPNKRVAAAAASPVENRLFGEDPAAGSVEPTFDLTSAFQGQEGITAVQQSLAAGRPFALAFVDVRMPPGLDGIETTAQLWALDPDLQVVICTAYSDYSWNAMIEKLGPSDQLVILRKPFDTVEVLQLASALTAKWQLQQVTKRRLLELEDLVGKRTQHLREANRQLESEIVRRIHREECLSLQNELTRLLTDSMAPANEVIGRILEMICQRMGWDWGRLWLVDRPARALRCAALLDHTGPGDHPHQLPARAGLAEHVWQTGDAVWIADTTQEEHAIHALSEEPAGWRAGLGFPLRLEGEIIGVLEFRGAQASPRDEALQQMLVTIGSLIGHSIERSKLEERLRHAQKMDAIGHLAGGVAHDFNNILTVIQGYAQVLKHKPGLDAETLGALNQVALAAERAAGLTRQLLTFSRKRPVQLRWLDLNEVLTHLRTMLQRLIGDDIVLTAQVADQPAVVNADESMLTQVLMNLACNARDAMPKGGRLDLRLDLLTGDEPRPQAPAEVASGPFVCLSVSDTGSGIAPEHLPHIFEPFFTTKDVGQGTGLGLCTVYGIVKQHRGAIDVSSQLGQGTRFRLFLPLVLTTETNPAPQPRPSLQDHALVVH